MQELSQIISTVGFPIAICLILLWYIKDITESHRKETQDFTKALENNTLMLERLCNKMDVEREELADEEN